MDNKELAELIDRIDAAIDAALPAPDGTPSRDAHLIRDKFGTDLERLFIDQGNAIWKAEEGKRIANKAHAMALEACEHGDPDSICGACIKARLTGGIDAPA